MELIYIFIFTMFAIPAAVLEYTENSCFGILDAYSNFKRGRGEANQQHVEYLQFRNNYVIIFSLMMGKHQPAATGTAAATVMAMNLAPCQCAQLRTGLSRMNNRRSSACTPCLGEFFQHQALLLGSMHTTRCPCTCCAFLAACSWGLVAGPIRVPFVRVLWLQRAGHRQAVHHGLWGVSILWHCGRSTGGQRVSCAAAVIP